MSDATHSSGPWYVNGELIDRAGAPVAHVFFPPDTGNRASEIAIGEARANARILAAAPDLLAALVELLDAYEDGTSQCHCENAGYVSPAPCTACRARAAIAKAKGGE